MTNIFDQITRQYGDLPYMKPKQANRLRQLILNNNARNILELGFFHGKSSAYIAATLEDRGGQGHLTTIDLTSARTKTPCITDILRDLNLSHRATPVFAHRSYTWELQRMITAPQKPRFDLCYLDGGHTWDVSGLGVFLVDRLLRPGGILVLDDFNWSIETSRYYQDNPAQMNRFSDDERRAKPVKLIWDHILPDLGYDHFALHEDLGWAIARKRD